ncbi:MULTISPECIES: metal ABC transporter ATP-binding protein [Vibrio harveyi group]|uniref:metal ABC transporter ATP-binding protein n=1 Tax=Vibrio harveyi group TaxID=717610 RepID=UPI00015447D8|nr:MULTISPECIES: metal ABC transporter ATP-binding protein [Vibrio harveyi group]EDL67750.1 cation ABC transporter, ATP-binding protein [Vibrio campbellii HY01]APX09473.1 ABC transporter ATP-binding protein [Vibrio campbellii]AQM71494.1 Zinc import ATP-binding protein ZnuC [Vibrio campbellii]ARR08197.1 ABC transporter ATP-binding protein [Vibrio campbellii]KGR36644.1 ABC transporter [Vibrio campbellii]
MPGPSISLDGVSLKYGDNLILQGIQTQFEAGQCHVIMGPNGGGKTSLLRSVLGLTPFTGDISVNWPDPKQTQQAGQIGYVPQKAMFEASLPLTVMDFVLLNQTRVPLFWRRKSKQTQQALAQLERVGMAARSDRRMGQLSGGEQQRVLFAQALLDDPSLLVLDEPTTGMDEQGVRYLEGLIHEVVAEGKTVLAVHHDVTAVRRLDAQVHVVNRQIVASGHHSEVLSPERIESLFKHYTAKVEAA